MIFSVPTSQLHLNISGINTENQSEDRRQSHIWGGCHSPFLVSSWQVTAITWANVMARQRVILEHNEGPMSACQTCSVLTHRQTRKSESPTPSYSIQTEKIQISLSGTGSWMSDYCELKQAPSLFAPLLLSLSSSSHHFFSCFISRPASSLRLLQLPWKMQLIKGCMKSVQPRVWWKEKWAAWCCWTTFESDWGFFFFRILLLLEVWNKYSEQKTHFDKLSNVW